MAVAGKGPGLSRSSFTSRDYAVARFTTSLKAWGTAASATLLVPTRPSSGLLARALSFHDLAATAGAVTPTSVAAISEATVAALLDSGNET